MNDAPTHIALEQAKKILFPGVLERNISGYGGQLAVQVAHALDARDREISRLHEIIKKRDSECAADVRREHIAGLRKGAKIAEAIAAVGEIIDTEYGFRNGAFAVMQAINCCAAKQEHR